MKPYVKWSLIAYIVCSLVLLWAMSFHLDQVIERCAC